MTTKFNQIKINHPKSVYSLETREITPIGNAFNNENDFPEEEAKVSENNKKPKFKFLKRNSQKNQKKETDVKENEEVKEEIENGAE